MLKIDLLKRKPVKISKIENFNKLNWGWSILLITILLGQLLYLSGFLIFYQFRNNDLKSNVGLLDRQLTERKDEVADYVVVSEMVHKISRENKGKYDYLKYLSYIRSLVPTGGYMIGADFKDKAIIYFGIKTDTVDSYRELEKTLVGLNQQDQAIFTLMSLNGLTRNTDGSYTSKLFMKVK